MGPDAIPGAAPVAPGPEVEGPAAHHGQIAACALAPASLALVDPDALAAPRMPSRRVLVAGGAGFLGAHLCRRLIGQGAEVVCLDSLVTGSRARIADLLADPRFRFVQHDIVSAPPLADPIDEIYALAWPGRGARVACDPLHGFATALLGTSNLLDLARRDGARLVAVSDGGGARDPQGAPGGPPPEAEVFHAEGQRAAERLLARAALGNGAEVRVARVFNAYGPGMTPGCGRVVPTFVVQALRGEPLTIHGNGQQRRAFCFVDDAVRGLLALMAAAEAPAGPVDLGGERVLTISQLAALVIDRTGAGGDVEYTPAVNPRDLVPDLGLARARLGWRPEVALPDGLDRTIAHFRRVLGAAC
jgi:UDP-glucuronate decarboxylase